MTTKHTSRPITPLTLTDGREQPMTTKHTSRPITPLTLTDGRELIDANGREIGFLREWEDGPLIVLSVNSHTALVEACQMYADAWTWNIAEENGVSHNVIAEMRGKYNNCKYSEHLFLRAKKTAQTALDAVKGDA